MYDEEGRTPRELRRLRGDAARQKKTALPLVVLGLPAWLASPVCSPDCYARHRRWLYRIGKFIRWIDDAADLSSDESAGAPNLVRRALARAASAGTGAMLARMIARRGRCLLEEWWDQVLNTGDTSVADAAVLDSVLVAWLGAPDLGHSQR